MNHQNVNYVKNSSVMSDDVKVWHSREQLGWGILHSYFRPTKLFSDAYLSKFLDISVKLFFPCSLDFPWHVLLRFSDLICEMW